MFITKKRLEKLIKATFLAGVGTGRLLAAAEAEARATTNPRFSGVSSPQTDLDVLLEELIGDPTPPFTLGIHLPQDWDCGNPECKGCAARRRARADEEVAPAAEGLTDPAPTDNFVREETLDDPDLILKMDERK
jgi:hypothetical protein